MGPVEHYLCSCGKEILECEFWLSMQQAVEEKGRGFDIANLGAHFTSDAKWIRRILGAQVRGPSFESLKRWLLQNFPILKSEYEKTLTHNQFLVEQTLNLQRGEIFLDGSKDPNRLTYLLNSSLFDISVIYMARDGRAQSNSRRQKKRWPVDYAGAAKEWAHTIGQMNSVVAQYPEQNIYKLAYEDLCHDPNKILNELWSFLNTEALEQDWDRVDLRARPHHILGNPMRTRDEIRIKLDERWRTEVSANEHKAFEKYAGSLNRALGYKNASSDQ